MTVAVERDRAPASPHSNRRSPNEGHHSATPSAQLVAATASQLNSRTLDSIRQHCAEKLQQRLQNPQLRAQKAFAFRLHNGSESKAIVPTKAEQLVQQQSHPASSTTQSCASGGISPLRERRLERALKRAASPMQPGKYALVPDLPLNKLQQVQTATVSVRSQSAPHARPVGTSTSKASGMGTRYPNKTVNECTQGKGVGKNPVAVTSQGRDLSARRTRARLPVAVARTAAIALAGATTGVSTSSTCNGARARSTEEHAASAVEHKPGCGVSPHITHARNIRPARARGGTQTSPRMLVSAAAAQPVSFQAQALVTATAHQCHIADLESRHTSPISHGDLKDAIFCDPPSEEKEEEEPCHAMPEADQMPASMRLAWESFSDGADDGKGTDSVTTPESVRHQAFNISDTPQADFVPTVVTGPHPLKNQRFTPGRTRQLKDVARSLESAALALHQVIGHSADVKGFGEAVTAFKENLNLSVGSSVNGPITDLKELKGCNLASKLLKASLPATRPEKMESGSQASPADSNFAGKINMSVPRASGPWQELASENAALRDALSNTSRRLAELQGEKESFLSEGVFDLVNTLYRSTPCSPKSKGGAQIALGSINN